MSKWMDKKNVDRYKQGIERYLEDKGTIHRVIKFDWGFQAAVELKDDYTVYAFEYQGEDQFSVKKTISEWDEEDYLVARTEEMGFITVK